MGTNGREMGCCPDAEELGDWDDVGENGEPVNTMRKPWPELTTMQKFGLVTKAAQAFYAPIAMIIATTAIASALNLLTSVANDVASVGAQFESQPIVDMKLLSGDKCPDGYFPMKNQERFKKVGYSNELDTAFTSSWPGTRTWCKCGAGGVAKDKCKANQKFDVRDASTVGCVYKDKTFKDAAGSCQENQTNAGCHTIRGQGEVALTKLPEYWPATLPVFNATADPNGTAPTFPTSAIPGKLLCIKRAGPKLVDLKIATKAADCASPKVKCGAICWDPKDSKPNACPVAAWIYTSNGGGRNVHSTSAASYQPLMNIVLGPGTPCIGASFGAGFDPALPSQSIDAPNNMVDNTVASGAFPNGECKSGSKKDREETASSGLDTRYGALASIDQYSLFSANGVAANGVEDKADVKASADKGLNMYNTYSNVENKPMSAGTTSLWQLSGRQGIEWTASCDASKETSRKTLVNYMPDIESLGDNQSGLLVTQILFGLIISGIIVPIMICMNLFQKDQDVPCVPGKGAEETKNIKVITDVSKTVSQVLIFFYLSGSLGSTGTLLGVFDEYAKAKCSDAVTIKAITEFADMVKQVHAANNSALTQVIISLALAVLGFIYDYMTGCKKGADFKIMVNPPANMVKKEKEKEEADKGKKSGCCNGGSVDDDHVSPADDEGGDKPSDAEEERPEEERAQEQPAEGGHLEEERREEEAV